MQEYSWSIISQHQPIGPTFYWGGSTANGLCKATCTKTIQAALLKLVGRHGTCLTLSAFLSRDRGHRWFAPRSPMKLSRDRNADIGCVLECNSNCFKSALYVQTSWILPLGSSSCCEPRKHFGRSLACHLDFLAPCLSYLAMPAESTAKGPCTYDVRNVGLGGKQTSENSRLPEFSTMEQSQMWTRGRGPKLRQFCGSHMYMAPKEAQRKRERERPANLLLRAKVAAVWKAPCGKSGWGEEAVVGLTRTQRSLTVRRKIQLWKNASHDERAWAMDNHLSS